MLEECLDAAACLDHTAGNVFEDQLLKQIAKEDLNEIPERREEDIKAIKQWIKQQPHLKKYGKTGKLKKMKKANSAY